MIKVKCFYILDKTESHLFKECTFLDENDEGLVTFGNIFAYLSISMTSDLYLLEDIQKHWEVIEKVEKDDSATEFGGWQHFNLEFHKGMVTFYHNEFEEEDGFPVLSCPLYIFKTVLTAWEAFLKLPKNIHSVVETEIPEWRR